MTTTNHVDAAAADFRRHTKGGGGWALGLAVASCVKPGRGQGGQGPLNDRYEVDKVSASEFARRSGTSPPRVLRYLEAWERAAEQGIVPPATDLLPEDWNDADCIPEGYEWSDYYDAGANGGSRVSGDPERAVEQLIAKHGAGVIADAVAHPEVARAVVQQHDSAMAVIRAQNERATARPAPQPREPRDSGGLMAAIDQALIKIGVKAFEHDAQIMRDALEQRVADSLPWRPGEREAVIRGIENGIQLGQEARDLIYRVTDDDLVQLLDQDTNNQ